ncbi:MAG: hypothetical protein ACFFCI_09345 [Promethearchaeota archaeon]
MVADNIEEAMEIMPGYYDPKPEVFDVWWDESDEMYKSIAKFKECDCNLVLAIWDDDYDCLGEVYIDEKIYKKIKSYMEG